MAEDFGTPLLDPTSGEDGAASKRSAALYGSHHERNAGGGVFSLEDSPSYAVLSSKGLITSQYRVTNVTDLDVKPANSDRGAYSRQNCLTWLCFPLCAPCIFPAIVKRFEVPAGHVRLVEDGRGGYYFCGQGMHQVNDYYTRVLDSCPALNAGVIVHGDRTVVTVEQGYVGFAMDKGQPILLPPGMHQWQSSTLRFERLIDLNSHVIRMGPYTVLTVDEGYCAVTQNNGKQIILEGGETHLLTHRNWKFEKFVSKKIQTNVLKTILATSADNVLMTVDSTVAWQVSDVEKAARMAAETMNPDGSDVTKGADITKLRNDVLMQSQASLSSFIGTVNYSSTFAVSAMVGGAAPPASAAPACEVVQAAAAAETGAKLAPPRVQEGLFDEAALTTAVGHANKLTLEYGVSVISINIISAKPADDKLMNSLARGAVAAAEAQQLETTAYGRARAANIEAEGEATAVIIRARGEAEAQELRAEGSRKAGELLASSELAAKLATIKTTAAAINKGTTMFFGADQSNMGGLLSNPAVVQGQAMVGRT